MGEKRWTIFVCPTCDKRLGGPYWCRCRVPASRARAVDVVPAAERDQLRQQVEGLLGEVSKMRRAETRTGLPYRHRSRLYKLADQVRKELE